MRNNQIKTYLLFVARFVFIGLIVSQTVDAATDLPLIQLGVAEPIYLSICGIALLYLGFYKRAETR